MRSEFGEQHFRPLETMELSWRWLSQSHTKMPEPVRQTIRALRPEVAMSVAKQAVALFEVAMAGLPFDASGDVEAVTSWLKALDVGGSESAVISWDDSNAVVTTWRTFVEYWSDFCYPSSDDVTIWPCRGSWVLRYAHTDEFRFRSLSALHAASAG